MFKFLKNVFNYGIGGVLAQVVGFLLIPLYTRYLSPSDYGILELCTSLTMVMVPVMRLGLPGAITRYYFDYREDAEKMNSLVTTTYRFLLVFSFGFGVISLVVLYFFNEQLLAGLAFYPYIILVVLTSLLMAPVNVQRKLIIAREQSALSAKINVIFAFLGIAFSIVAVVLLRRGVVGIIEAQLITAVVAAVYALYYLKPNLKGAFDKVILKDNLRYGLGIFPHHMMVNFSPFMSRLLLASYGSMSSLGLFSIAIRFNQPLELFFSALTPTFQPLYYSIRKKSGDNQAELTYYFKLIILIGVGIFGLFINVMSDVIPLVLDERYHFAAPYVPIIGVSLIGKLYYLIFSSEIFYLKKTKLVSSITFVGIAVNLLLSILLVGKYDAVGISWAFSISYLFWGIMAFAICRRVSDLNYSYKFLILGLVAALLLFLDATLVDSIFLRYGLMLVILVVFMQLSGLGKIGKVMKKIQNLGGGPAN